MARKSSAMQERSDRKLQKQKSSEEIMFSNKQKALCKQVTHLSILCGIEFAILIFSITGEPFIFGKLDAESVVDRFFQAKKATECTLSCRTTVEKICEHKRHTRMDHKKKLAIDDKGKGKAIKENSECSAWEKIDGTDSERLEEHFTCSKESSRSFWNITTLQHSPKPRS
ncbi:hypothetical protein FXO37_17403 [Capsicum annuum]|nr:hypothetical protein FXO37_17403 [Capsicum annuum]